jgi:hypothetical protein
MEISTRQSLVVLLGPLILWAIKPDIRTGKKARHSRGQLESGEF